VVTRLLLEELDTIALQLAVIAQRRRFYRGFLRVRLLVNRRGRAVDFVPVL
jgi:hypothetical protein